MSIEEEPLHNNSYIQPKPGIQRIQAMLSSALETHNVKNLMELNLYKGGRVRNSN